ncbi:MAG: zinc-dependent metalloprotease family protein, partial [Gemmataceae bacterium]
MPARLPHSRKSIVRKVFGFGFDRLEDRLTPALSAMGPYTEAMLEKYVSSQAGIYELYTAIPEVKGATPSLKLSEAVPFSIDLRAFGEHLAGAPEEANAASGITLAIPTPEGTFSRFRVWEVEMMEPALAEQMSGVATWRGQGIDDPTAVLAADITPQGFHAQIRSPLGGWYVDPYYHLNSDVYVAYEKEDLSNQHGEGCGCLACQGAILGDDLKTLISSREPMESGPEGGGGGFEPPPLGETLTNGATLRIYRAAVAATGEYSTFHGGTVALSQAAIVTAMNRVSGVYETEMSIRMVLVGNNTSIVYTNAATDPYTNGNPSAMINEAQTNIDSLIGNANYDIGHVFGTNSGGLAGLGVVGQTGNKARGVTGSGAPIGDPFFI